MAEVFLRCYCFPFEAWKFRFPLTVISQKKVTSTSLYKILRLTEESKTNEFRTTCVIWINWLFEWANHLRGVKIYKLWWCWSRVNVSWVNSVCNRLQFNFTFSLSSLAEREHTEVTVYLCLFFQGSLSWFIKCTCFSSYRTHLWALHSSQQAPQIMILAQLLLWPTKLMTYVPFMS